VWARLREGVPVEAAREAIPCVAASLQSAEPREQGWGVDLVPIGGRRTFEATERSLSLLSGTVALILLIALMNSANLLGIRTLTRSRELGIRVAIGGSRSRIARQLLAEGLLLGLLAGVCSLALAWLALTGIEGLAPESWDWWSVYSLGIERRTLLFGFTAALAAGTILGLVPSASVLRSDNLLRSRTTTDDTRTAKRARSVLVVAQVALSMTLLAGGALFVGSFLRLISVDPGFDFRRVAMADIELSNRLYPTDRDRAAYLDRFEAVLEANPAVTGATTMGGGNFYVEAVLSAEGFPPPPNQPDIIPYASVNPDYLSVTGTELVAGRSFEPLDVGQNVAIIDVDLARFLWGTENVIGRRFRVRENEWQEVVGVARDLRMLGRDQREGPYQILYPRSPDQIWVVATLVVRTEGDPRLLLQVLREAARSLDPEQTFWRLRTGADALSEPEQSARFLAVLMSLLAGIGVALAGVGVFGVLAYSVGRRARELGVRKALGAKEGALLAMVLREGLSLGGFGVLLGVGSALAIAGMAESLLFEVDPRDPGLLAFAAILFLVVIASASLLPARRATRVDPLEVLRAE
jgi:putative ABC transport system permease protein